MKDRIKEYQQMEETTKKWEDRHRIMENKVKWIEENNKKDNVVIFGLEMVRNEDYMDNLETLVKFLNEKLVAEIS
jgi:hypothetical protein